MSKDRSALGKRPSAVNNYQHKSQDPNVAGKKLGIIGGMGSVAAAYMFKRLVELTPTEKDQEYIEVILHNNTGIPDRTQGILYGGPSPLPELQRSVEICNRFGASYIALACMTSHYFIPQLQRNSRAEFIDGIQESVDYCTSYFPDAKAVGILASTGNLKCNLFQSRFEEAGIRSVVFDDRDQQYYFMDPIYEPWGIKAGNVTGKPRERFLEAVERLRELGADAIVGGCSEIPLVLSQVDISIPLIDSIDCICNAAISKCIDRPVRTGELRKS